jgi:hypothetical protein
METIEISYIALIGDKIVHYVLRASKIFVVRYILYEGARFDFPLWLLACSLLQFSHRLTLLSTGINARIRTC